MDYYLYCSLSNHLRENKFDDENDLEMNLLNFFDEKPQDFSRSSLYQSVGIKPYIVMEHTLFKDNCILVVEK